MLAATRATLPRREQFFDTQHALACAIASSSMTTSVMTRALSCTHLQTLTCWFIRRQACGRSSFGVHWC